MRPPSGAASGSPNVHGFTNAMRRQFVCLCQAQGRSRDLWLDSSLSWDKSYPCFSCNWLRQRTVVNLARREIVGLPIPAFLKFLAVLIFTVRVRKWSLQCLEHRDLRDCLF